MPDERTVSCPHCGADRVTRALPNAQLACSCGRKFRAPAPEAAPPVADASAPAPSSTKVVRASSTKVRQTARPRSTNPPKKAPPPKKAAATKKSPPPPDAKQHKAKVVGRRGGLGYYGRIRGNR